MPTRFLWAAGFVLASAALLVFSVSSLIKGPTEPPAPTVTSRAVLDRVADAYFVVTKTVYVDQTAEINVDRGSTWSNFLWGQKVQARGVVRVDVGVDLSRLAEKDIAVDNASHTVRIDVPPADIMNASQYGDIEVRTEQGVLKRLLENDPNEDHNRALEQLLAGARESVRGDAKIFDEARGDSLKLLRLIVQGLGYELVDNLTDAAR